MFSIDFDFCNPNNNLSWEEFAYTNTAGSLYFYKCRYNPAIKMVCLNIQVGTSIGTERITLGSIPAKYAPPNPTYVMGVSDGSVAIKVYLGVDGSIGASCVSTQSSVRFFAVYPVA